MNNECDFILPNKSILYYIIDMRNAILFIRESSLLLISIVPIV